MSTFEFIYLKHYFCDLIKECQKWTENNDIRFYFLKSLVHYSVVLTCVNILRKLLPLHNGFWSRFSKLFSKKSSQSSQISDVPSQSSLGIFSSRVGRARAWLSLINGSSQMGRVKTRPTPILLTREKVKNIKLEIFPSLIWLLTKPIY